MPFLLAEILNFQGSTHRIGVGSFSKKDVMKEERVNMLNNQHVRPYNMLLSFRLCNSFENINRLFSHCFGIMYVSLQCGFNIGVSKSGLNIFYVCARFDQQCRVSMSQAVIVKCKMHFMVNNPAAILK